MEEREKHATLCVQGLKDGVRRHALEAEFEAFGRLVRVDIVPGNARRGMPDSRIAFVEFKDRQDARKAMRSLNGRMVQGKCVMIQFARRGAGTGRNPNVPIVANGVRRGVPEMIPQCAGGPCLAAKFASGAAPAIIPMAGARRPRSKSPQRRSRSPERPPERQRSGQRSSQQTRQPPAQPALPARPSPPALPARPAQGSGQRCGQQNHQRSRSSRRWLGRSGDGSRRRSHPRSRSAEGQRGGQRSRQPRTRSSSRRNEPPGRQLGSIDARRSRSRSSPRSRVRDGDCSRRQDYHRREKSSESHRCMLHPRSNTRQRSLERSRSREGSYFDLRLRPRSDYRSSPRCDQRAASAPSS